MAETIPSSAVDICNLALAELKVSKIESLDQVGSDTAELCKDNYDLVRRALIREHTWNFAKTEATLNKTSSGSSDSFSDVYPLPAGYLRLLSVGDVYVGDDTLDYDIRAIDIGGSFTRCLLLNNSGATTQAIIFARNVTDVSEFDPLFTMLFKYTLASTIAPSLTLKPSIQQNIESKVLQYSLKAKGVDGQERRPVRKNTSNFLNARKYGIRKNTDISVTF